jgi:tetratricopeptide (TPR) repeat protein
VIAIATSSILHSENDQYQRLKTTLSLGLRRQILIAVCDDMTERDRAAAQLQTELGETRIIRGNEVISYPKLVNLQINLERPQLLLQIAQWLKQHFPSSQGTAVKAELPSFQILGVEKLTTTPPDIQRQFLSHLQNLERYLHHFDSSLLLWLPRPWLRSIRQSAPEFWRWRTGVFEFHADPTPPQSSHSKSSRACDPVVITNPAVNSNSTAPRRGKGDLQVVTPKKQLVTAGSRLQQTEEGTQREEKVKVISRGITHPPLETVAQVQQLIQDNQPREVIAQAYLEVGQRYRDRVLAGEATVQNFEQAIQGYYQGWQWLEEGGKSEAETLNGLGNLYWMRSRHGKGLEAKLTDLEQAVEVYNLALGALTKLSPKAVASTDNSQIHATVLTNLGATYSDLACYQSKVDYLTQGIHAYKSALEYCCPNTNPLKYGSTQNNLGTAYWHLAQTQDAAVNLKSAIASYREAITQYHPEQAPQDWAMIQNNLGTAYWNLAQYENPQQWLQLSLSAYSNALRYRTPDQMPKACAATYNNLGTTCWHIAQQVSTYHKVCQEYLKKAATAYDAAISLALKLQQTSPQGVGFDLLNTYNNLGVIHYQLATDSKFDNGQASKLAHLEASLYAHLQALAGSEANSDLHHTAFNAIIKTVQGFYQEGGINGQNSALSQLPGQLLPDILPHLSS